MIGEYDYAAWRRRVTGYLIDVAPTVVGFVVFLTGYGLWIADLTRSGFSTSWTSSGVVPMIVGASLSVPAIGWQVYNRWIIAGRTGQSIGKRVAGIVLISEATGRAIGPRNAFIRDLVHILDGVTGIGFLWPLWDEKRQTLTDKIMNTAVVDQPKSESPDPR